VRKNTFCCLGSNYSLITLNFLRRHSIRRSELQASPPCSVVNCQWEELHFNNQQPTTNNQHDN